MSGKVKDNTNITLGTLYRHFKSKKIQLPDWQRDHIWDKKKITQWEEDIRNGGQLPGVISTFNIQGDETVYLNDGAQRTFSTNTFATKINDEKKVMEMFDEVYITKQHIEYKTNDDAFEDFFRINQGTVCTNFELGKGILSTKLQNFQIWEPEIQELHKIGAEALIKMHCKRTSKREFAHKYYRDDYALFLRFVEKNKELSNDNSGRSKVNSDISSESNLENRLQLWCNRNGIEKFKSEIIRFKKHVDDNLAVYESIWKDNIEDNTMAPTACNVRWFLAVSIYKRHNNIGTEKYKEFIEKYIQLTQGGSGFVPKGERDRITLGLSDLFKLKKVCKHLPIENFHDDLKKRKKRNSSQVKVGYGFSHIKNFSEHGEGPGIIEPNLINISRGKSNINDIKNRTVYQ